MVHNGAMPDRRHSPHSTKVGGGRGVTPALLGRGNGARNRTVTLPGVHGQKGRSRGGYRASPGDVNSILYIIDTILHPRLHQYPVPLPPEGLLHLSLVSLLESTGSQEL